MNKLTAGVTARIATNVVAGFLVTLLCVGVSSAAARAAEPPSPNYSGDVLTRSTLTGDWGGARNELANKGVKFDANLTNVVQGVVDGGKSHEWEYGGRGNLTTNVDTGKLGLWPGGFFTLELEGNWQNAITARETGAIMPANTNQLFPEPADNNFNVPQVSFAQFLSPYAGIFLGKLDTMSGDENEFAHGKGDKQFLNLALNINPVALVVTPYSTLGAGVIILPTKDPNAAIVKLNVLQANGSASTPGFDDLSEDKLTFAAEGRVRTHFLGKTGHQLLGVEYSNKNYTSLDQRIGSVLDDLPLNEQDDSWDVYYNFDQYVYQPDPAGERGFGVFGRLGVADGNPNPMQTFLSFGIGGQGPCRSRAHDGFGIGYYFIDINSPSLQESPVTHFLLRDEYGFEAYYSFAITPWMHLTLDAQVVRPSQEQAIRSGENVDTATILGVRQEFVF